MQPPSPQHTHKDRYRTNGGKSLLYPLSYTFLGFFFWLLCPVRTKKCPDVTQRNEKIRPAHLLWRPIRTPSHTYVPPAGNINIHIASDGRSCALKRADMIIPPRANFSPQCMALVWACLSYPFPFRQETFGLRVHDTGGWCKRPTLVMGE